MEERAEGMSEKRQLRLFATPRRCCKMYAFRQISVSLNVLHIPVVVCHIECNLILHHTLNGDENLA